MKNRISRICVFALFLFVFVGGLAAQANYGQTLLSNTESSLKQLASSVVSLLQVILGLGGLVTLVMIIFKVLKGEREAAEKLAWWVFGLTVGFVLLVVLKNVALV